MVVVQCPGCPTRLSAPEGAAGKQLKCPKCGALATVPEQMVESKPAPPPKPKAKVTAESVDDDDEDDRPRSRKRRDDDEDDDDRPRKKKRRDDDDDDEYDHDRKRGKRRPARHSGGGGGKMAVMIGVGLIALIGVGVAIFMLVGKGGLGRKAPPPGWKEVNNAEAGVRGFFPTDPMVVALQGNMFGGFGGMNIPGVGEMPQTESMHQLNCVGAFGGRGGVTISVQVTRFRNTLPRAMRDAGFGGAFGGGKSVRWLGGSGLEMNLGGQVVRQVYTDKAIVQATISGAKPEEAEAFFDNLELTK